MKSKSANKSSKKTTVVVSGGFDPIHIGHVRMIQQAAKLGDELIVVLNNDNWLLQKKGFVFMKDKERKEVLEAMKGVTKVVMSHHKKNPSDMSVAPDLKKLKPDIFARGGDRGKGNIPSAEVEVMQTMGGKVIYDIGKGGKVQSSSVLASRLIEYASQNSPCPCRSGKPYSKCGLKHTLEHKRNLQKLLNS